MHVSKNYLSKISVLEDQTIDNFCTIRLRKRKSNPSEEG